MGSSQSKVSSFGERIKSSVEDEIIKRGMLQREIQMAVNIAKARDAIQIFGSLWLTLVTGVSIAHLAGRKPPSLIGVPVVVGGIVLGNLADMAYGNKLQRVTREAEYILAHEKERFVPLEQAPFAKLYTEEQRAAMLEKATPVGKLFPSSIFSRSEK
mmetsp:Transcript_23441/g.34595  ORF Transcript_23441/g.34595 Transcript_23441/m.34595 type:complete len:157 (+) Transcript_23441:56-526(+)|eukprot:CAMPEP_0194212092 /NCGR_PEP_ID=MMETSP0156-20130528/11730_1 /TAXON_ID=33649 /ORGANISM="Thalassionema nitzschioides, Strain L26-B" /LENGTH=156 /DNA_ID=CAMNT_0038939829 /DNA_START=34 /DNA_END=504 /DNA_ORIENTATION=+